MASHPTVTIVVVACRVFTRLGDIANERQQRLVQLREVEHLGRPIVLLGVDIDCIVTVPRRSEIIVPYTLQIHRHAHSTRGRNHQVTTKLEVEHLEVVILCASGHSLQTLVGRQRRHLALCAQLHIYSVEERCEVLNVATAQLLERILLGGGHTLGSDSGVVEALLCGVLVETVETCSGCDEQYHAAAILHLQLTVCAHHLAINLDWLNQSGKVRTTILVPRDSTMICNVVGGITLGHKHTIL